METSVHATSILTNCTLGKNVTIGPFCFLTDTALGDNVTIEGNVRIEKSRIADDVQILWGALIRESELASGCIIGCEVKKCHLGRKNKAKHPGTSVISTTSGEAVNFGGGVKFANYDGTGKGTFVLGDRVFIGCNTVLSVRANAVTTIESGSKIAANLHVNTDIPADSLVYADRETGKLTIRAGYYAQ